jgi:hypothetical protein
VTRPYQARPTKEIAMNLWRRIRNNCKMPLPICVALILAGCGGGGGGSGGGGTANSRSTVVQVSSSSTSSTSVQVKSTFGIGGTSPIFNSPANINSVVSLLQENGITRDSSQIPATTGESQQLEYADKMRTNSLLSVQDYHQLAIKALNQKAGIANSVRGLVEVDLRNNSNLWMFGGGHAGHDYFALDGKFLDILFDMANYIALSRSGRTFDSIYYAADNIVAYYLSSNRTLPSGGYYYHMLTPQEKMSSDELYLSMVGGIYYHEFGHYLLLHMLDSVRAQYDLSGTILYSSASEDDADFVGGALSAKAGLDESAGLLMFDLMTFYSAYKSGQVYNFINITNNFVVQFQQSSITYSSLAVRKSNFSKGYDSYH